MFEDIRKQVKANFAEMAKTDLFVIYPEKDKIWDAYLSGFPEETRQTHNCNNCKSFLRRYGGVVALKDHKIVSIWDGIDGGDEYNESIQRVRRYVKSLPISDVFLTDEVECGVDSNKSHTTGVKWTHFAVKAPRACVTSKDTIPRKKSFYRTSKETLKRALDEITMDSTETLLELIATKTLYRGNTYKRQLEIFLDFQKAYKKVPSDLRDNAAWSMSLKDTVTSGIRNSAIGTLLVDLSGGMELDPAVRKYEAMVAPSNYKRPTALATKAMIQRAAKEVEEAGLTDSLHRRYAKDSDLTVNDILFTDKSSAVKSVFDELSDDALVSPRSLKKVEDITISDFLKNVLPEAKTVEALVENRHKVNFAALITEEVEGSKPLFAWDNPFSWSYTGGITDSMKERVKAAGGSVTGDLRFSIQWNEDEGDRNIDLDAHAFEPGDSRIYFGSYKKPRKTYSGGQLDVDIITPGNRVAVENITWPSKQRLKKGTYRFLVNNYSSARCGKGFSAEIEADGEIYEFHYPNPIQGGKNVDVAEVYFDGNTFKVTPKIDSRMARSSEKWGVKTNVWKRVNKLMLSPNHWGDQEKGNKHFFFFLEGCACDDETPRGIFNEFLRPELNEHRKAMEMVGAKLRVADSPNQVAGLGFSETQRNNLLVRVTNRSKRVLNVKF